MINRTRLKRVGLVLATLLIVAFLCRNSIARYAAVQIGSRLLLTRIEVASIDIRWRAVTISGLQVFEPEMDDEVQVSVARIRVVPNVLDGFSTGVWLSEISIDRPIAEVRFDEQGRLRSVFPAGGGESTSTGPMKVPVAKVVVKNAGLIVHQAGRQRLNIEDVHVSLDASDRVVIRVEANDVLGSQCRFDCDLDALSFQGSSRVTVENLRLNSKELTSLPLVPASVHSEPFSVAGGLSIVCDHPANEMDFRKHTMRFHAWTSDAIVDRIGMVCERMNVFIDQEDGRLSAKGTANPLRGEWQLSAAVDWTLAKPELTIQSTLLGCQPSGLAKGLAQLSELQTDATASTFWKIGLDDGRVRFEGNLDVGAEASSYEKLVLPDVHGSLMARGSVRIRDINSLAGEIRGRGWSDPLKMASLVEGLGDSLGNSLSETLSARSMNGHVVTSGEFVIPLESLADIRTYTAKAMVKAESVGTADLRLDDATVSVTMAKGVVDLSVVDLVVRDVQKRLLAEVKSHTTVDLSGAGRVLSKSEIFAEPSVQLVRWLGMESLDPRGRVLARLQASCPTVETGLPERWQAEVHCQTQSLSAVGETISDLDWRATMSGGEIKCSPIEATWRGHSLIANASAKIGSTIAIRGDFWLDSLRLGELSDVMSRYSATRLSLDGLASIGGSFALDRDRTTGVQSFQASGKANLMKSSYARTRIGEAELNWAAGLDGLTLTSRSTDFLGGRFDVSADMKELDWTRTQVRGTFAEVQAGRLAGVAGQTIATTGTFNGGFRVTSIASLESLTGEAWMASSPLSVDQLPLQINQARVTIQDGAWSVGATGTIVDGTLVAQASGSLPRLGQFLETTDPAIAKIPLIANVKFTGLRTQSLVRPLRLPREVQSVSATISAECSRTSAAWDGRHVCVASATVEDLRYQHQGLSQRMSVETVLHENRLEITGVRGRFADGALNGTGEVSFDQTLMGRFDVSASHVNLRRATSPLGIQDVSGAATVRVRGRLGPVISGQIDASVDNLTAGGVAVRKAKFPVDWSFRPASQMARWQCRAGTVAVGGGNVRIASEGSFARGLNSTTSVRIESVDLSKLMQNGSVGSGTITGNAIVRTKNAHGIEDLVGSFAIEMKDIEAMQMPILDQLPKMVTLSPPVPGRGQDGGTVRGRIAGAMVHLDEVAIHQSNVQVLVTGNATMTGKLNLDVVASTQSTSPTDQLISLLDSPVMLAAPAPVALVVKANELLKDRVVRVHVGGTADRPTLRLQPGKQLSQDAVRFFLSSSLGPAADRLSNTQSKTQRR